MLHYTVRTLIDVQHYRGDPEFLAMAPHVLDGMLVDSEAQEAAVYQVLLMVLENVGDAHWNYKLAFCNAVRREMFGVAKYIIDRYSDLEMTIADYRRLPHRNDPVPGALQSKTVDQIRFLVQQNYVKLDVQYPQHNRAYVYLVEYAMVLWVASPAVLRFLLPRSPKVAVRALHTRFTELPGSQVRELLPIDQDVIDDFRQGHSLACALVHHDDGRRLIRVMISQIPIDGHCAVCNKPDLQTVIHRCLHIPRIVGAILQKTSRVDICDLIRWVLNFTSSGYKANSFGLFQQALFDPGILFSTTTRGFSDNFKKLQAYKDVTYALECRLQAISERNTAIQRRIRETCLLILTAHRFHALPASRGIDRNIILRIVRDLVWPTRWDQSVWFCRITKK